MKYEANYIILYYYWATSQYYACRCGLLLPIDRVALVAWIKMSLGMEVGLTP